MSSSKAPAVGIDFGTSNSAVAAAQPDGSGRLLPIEGEHTTLPTALFFQDEDRLTLFGRAAMQRYLTGEEGRLMRSLKSLLGSSLIEERTAVHGESVPFRDIVTRFLVELTNRAETALGARPRRAVMGRPVRFVDDDDTRDAAAQSALEACARAAGYEEVRFELEPIAAAFDYERRIDKETRVMVVDIGGGTSDFTVVRLGPDRMARADRTDDVLATTGVHIGGTDFDRRLSLDEVMPLLGLHHIGPSGREVPNATFFNLATWHLIQWLYAPQSIRKVSELRRDYADPVLHARLMRVLEQRDGHRLANAVEEAKIASAAAEGAVPIDLGFVERGLSASLSADAVARHLRPLLESVGDCASDCLRRASLPRAPDAIYLTGGSSALAPFQQMLRRRFPETPLVEGDRFGGVAAGLAYAGGVQLR